MNKKKDTVTIWPCKLIAMCWNQLIRDTIPAIEQSTQRLKSMVDVGCWSVIPVAPSSGVPVAYDVNSNF